MAIHVQKIFPALLVSVIALLLGASMMLPLRKEIRAVLYRLGIIMTIESLVLVGSFYLWNHVAKAMQFAKSHSQTQSQTQTQSQYQHFGVDGIATVQGQIREGLRDSHGPRFIKFLMAVVLVLAQFSFLTNFVLGGWHNWFSHLCYVCLGFLVHCSLSLLVLDVGRWLGSLLYVSRSIGSNTPKSETTKRKKYRFSNIKLFIALFYGLSVGIYGLYNASKPPSVKRVPISISGLSSTFDGLKIVQINDIHLGPTVSREKLARVVDITNSLEPDIVVIVGDLVDGKVIHLKDDIQPIQEIQAKLGKYYVSGNHEYYTADVDGWFEHIASLGFTVLHNSHVVVPEPRDRSSPFFYLAGIDDLQATRMQYDGHGMDLKKALAACDPNHPIILLAHQPAAAKLALDSKYGKQIKLVLSGHTHGGQMFPLMIGAYLLNPFFLGLYEYKDSFVYVSPGTVYWGIPMRIGTTMEITEIILRAAERS